MKHNILCVASVEDDLFLRQQLSNQTLQADSYFIYVDNNPAKGIDNRRKRIAENQKILQQAVRDLKPDLVWQVESDGVLSANCLQKLYDDYLKLKNKNFGYVSGIEIGRHGLYCIGAWQFINDNEFKSLDYRLKGINQVDATGFYCLLATRRAFLSGVSSWNGEVYGPDVNFGLSLKKQGFRIYTDSDIKIGHKTKRGIINVDDMSTQNATFYKTDKGWNYKCS